ncbi:alpha-2-HS-glycoprotein 2 [Solea solea]|uniref:alpha-2-HS-glycoprotein 2 n=1 Tax=Solea solea TaxID=90069 RepID=UPI00272CC412|nr:alpha-2-HS-glycoprotein 2 [Solea solea]
MKTLSITVVLVLLAGAWAQVNVLRPLCDSPEAEEAALLARDYLNAQHTHGYKYELNRIEDIKIFPGLNGSDTYVLEVDLLETDCHVLDPTPVANCTVRPKMLTAVEGDCDVVLKKVGGVLTVTAFKCKTEESTEDCVGCFNLLPLNDTAALDFVHTSLATFNNNTGNVTYAILEVGRISSQVVSGGHQYLAEYVVIEANCTDEVCVPTSDPLAERGICTAKGFARSHVLQCKMFHIPMVPVVDANSTMAAVPVSPPAVHIHTGSMSHKHGLRHHKLTPLHNPDLSGHLSESSESAEIVPVASAVAVDSAPPAAADANVAAAADIAVDSASDSSSSREDHRLKRDAPAAPIIALTHFTISETGPGLVRSVCPGRIRFFD